MRSSLDKAEIILKYLFIVFWGYTVLSVICLDQANAKATKGYQGTNLLPVLTIIVILFLYRWKGEYLKKIKFAMSDRRFNQILCAVILCVFLLQLICAYFIVKPLAYDFKYVREAAIATALENTFSNSEYFSRCANNKGIMFVFTILVKIFKRWSVVVAIGLLLVDLSILLTAKIVYRITKSQKQAFLIFIIGVVLFGFSYRSFIPYTDNYAVFFYMFPLYVLFTKADKKGWICAGAVSFGIACFIKVTVFILLIAGCIIAFLKCKKWNAAVWKRIALFSVVFLLSFVSITKGRDVYFDKLGFEENEELNLGIWHYFMLGQNTKSLGNYNKHDAAYSRKFDTADERAAHNRKEAFKRVKDRKLIENLKFYTYKNYMNYDDGTFSAPLKIANGEEFGESFMEKIFIRGKSYYQYYAFLEQTLWLGVLLLILLGAVRMNASGPYLFFAITVMGVSAYVLLFEGRSKYLFMFIPLYLILASGGLKGRRFGC